MHDNKSGSVGPSHPRSEIAVSVIIPVYNDEEGLSRCLDALVSQTLPESEYEIIVVDNGSNRTPRTQMPDNARLLVETRPGSYAARNTAITQAETPVLAFTDADCLPDPNWLVEGLEFLRAHSDVSSVGGRIEVFVQDPALPTPVEVYELMKAFPQEEFVADFGFAATANLFVRRDVFEAVGPFNTALRSGGDLEFGNRSTGAGFRMDYLDSLVVRHPARRTMRESLHKLLRTMAGIRDLYSILDRPFPYPLAGTLRGLVPPVPSVMRALGNEDVGPLRDRVKYAYAVVVIHYARTAFRFGLLMGARSPR